MKLSTLKKEEVKLPEVEKELTEDKGDISEEELDSWKPDPPSVENGEVTMGLGPDPLTIILDVTQTLITKVEALPNIKEKVKIIGKLKGALELLSMSCN